MDKSICYNSSIATVKHPKKKIAKTSFDLLFSLITTDMENKYIILNTELVERAFLSI